MAKTKSTGVLSGKEIELIGEKLNDIGVQLLALNRLADFDMEEEEQLRWFLVITKSITRSAVMSLDACIGKTGGTMLGDFHDEDELEGKKEEVESHG